MAVAGEARLFKSKEKQEFYILLCSVSGILVSRFLKRFAPISEGGRKNVEN
jgi:hypothetical protein